MATITDTNDWRTRPAELPLLFADWLECIASPQLKLVGDEAVLRHAWHLDENLWSYDCRWCNGRGLGALFKR